MSDEIQQTRYDRLIRRVTGIIGPGSKVSQVITELFPMIDLENVPIELLRLGGTRVSFGGGTVLGVAGEAARAQLFNPVKSGHLVVITSVFFAAAQSSIVRWGTNNIPLTTNLATQLFRDTRDVSPVRPIAEVRTQSSVALATGTNQTRLPAVTNFILQDPNGVIVLAPGTGFEIGSAVLNNKINFSFHWRERTAEPSELNV